jgi:hypothetical protein
VLPLLAQEREQGVLDVSQVPSGILAHGPGYIDPDIGYAMIFPGMTIVKILFVDIVPVFFGG